jgi:hypothetical protein
LNVTSNATLPPANWNLGATMRPIFDWGRGHQPDHLRVAQLLLRPVLERYVLPE